MKYFLASTHSASVVISNICALQSLGYEIDIVPSSILGKATLSNLCDDVGERSGTFFSYLTRNTRVKCDVDTKVKARNTQYRISIQHIVTLWQNFNRGTNCCTAV